MNTKRLLACVGLLALVSPAYAKPGIFIKTRQPINLTETQSDHIEATKPVRPSATPPGIRAIATGFAGISLTNDGFVSSDYGRGVWLSTAPKAQGGITATGIGTINGNGYICPAGHVAKALAIGEIGCSGLRATILNPNDPSKVTVNYGGDITATSAAINALSKGKGPVLVDSAGNISGYEFGIETHGSKVTVKNSGDITTNGTGILANNDGTKALNNRVNVINTGTITSDGDSFTHKNVHKNPAGILGAISAGSLSGQSTVRVNNSGLLSSTRSTGIYTYGTGPTIVRNTGEIDSNQAAIFVKNVRSKVIINQLGTINGDILVGGRGNNVIIRNSGSFNGQIIDKGINNHIHFRRVSAKDPPSPITQGPTSSKTSRMSFAISLNLAYEVAENKTLWVAYQGGYGNGSDQEIRVGMTFAF